MMLSLKNKSTISLPKKETIKKKLKLHNSKDSNSELPSSPLLDSKRGSDNSLLNNSISSNNALPYVNSSTQLESISSKLPSNSSSGNHSRTSSNNVHRRKPSNPIGITFNDSFTHSSHHLRSQSQSQISPPIIQLTTSNTPLAPFSFPLPVQSPDKNSYLTPSSKHKPPSSANSSYFHLSGLSRQESSNSNDALNHSNVTTPGALYIDIPPSAHSSHSTSKQTFQSSRDNIFPPSNIGLSPTTTATSKTTNNLPQASTKRKKKGLSKIIKTRFDELDNLFSDNLERRSASIEMENLKLIELLNTKYLNLININETFSTTLNRLNGYLNELNEKSTAQIKRKSHNNDLFKNLNDLSVRLDTVKSSLSENKQKLDGFNNTLVEFQNFKKDSKIQQTKNRNMGFFSAGLIVLILILHHIFKIATT